MRPIKTTALAALSAGIALPALAEPIELRMWYHGAGTGVEETVVVPLVNDFNESQDEYRVTLEAFPQLSYNDSVVAAALAGNLPDILDVDGPVMPNWVWSGYMQPLGLDQELVEDFLPGAIGTIDGEVYSVGLWDAAVAMMTRCSLLDEYGIRRPTLDEPWTLEEFDQALVTLKESGDFEYPLDLGMSAPGEWYPYAFSPFLQSFGGDIVDRETYTTAEGVLNGDAALEFGRWWQSLFERDLAPGTSQDPADRETGLLDGRYAMSWNGNWAARAFYDAHGEDACFLPAPDFGEGPVIGAASWQFGASAATEHLDGVRAFIEHATQPKYLVQFADGTGLLPATRTAAAETEMYSEGAPLEVFFELSERQAKVRPVTPGYVVAAKVFEKALADIANGADVEDALDAAVDEIDADIARNQGYGHDG